MKTTFDMLRVWAAITGLVLVVLVFVQIWLGQTVTDTLPMLAASIAGFEMFMVFQAIRDRRAGDGSNG